VEDLQLSPETRKKLIVSSNDMQKETLQPPKLVFENKKQDPFKE
jgi:hypothetical protein